MKAKKIILCEGTGCPIKDKCAFWNESMDKSKTVHWGLIPYNHERGKCNYFEEIDIDIPFNDN